MHRVGTAEPGDGARVLAHVGKTDVSDDEVAVGLDRVTDVVARQRFSLGALPHHFVAEHVILKAIMTSFHNYVIMTLLPNRCGERKKTLRTFETSTVVM